MNKAGYSFNSTIAGIEEADAILLIGTNPRVEATLVNARIRKTWLDRRVPVSLIGEPVDLTYPYNYLGENAADLKKAIKEFGKFEKPMIIVGAGAFAREDGAAVQALVREVAEEIGCISEEWNGYNVLHDAASRMAALEMEFVPQAAFDPKETGLVYLLGVDNPYLINEIHNDAYVIYQGHHGDLGAHRADLILPGAAYTEKDGIYMNIEGRAQRSRKAVFPPGEAREDWAILRALSDRCNQTLDFNDLADLRADMITQYPRLGSFDEIVPAEWGSFGGNADTISDQAFSNQIEDFYLTNVITRASETMKRCSSELGVNKEQELEAAE